MVWSVKEAVSNQLSPINVIPGGIQKNIERIIMLIIGEKINGTRSQVAKAIAERDKDYIQDLARRQTEAGADYLDVNAGTKPDMEPDALVAFMPLKI